MAPAGAQPAEVWAQVCKAAAAVRAAAMVGWRWVLGQSAPERARKQLSAMR